MTKFIFAFSGERKALNLYWMLFETESSRTGEKPVSWWQSTLMKPVFYSIDGETFSAKVSLLR